MVHGPPFMFTLPDKDKRPPSSALDDNTFCLSPMMLSVTGHTALLSKELKLSGQHRVLYTVQNKIIFMQLIVLAHTGMTIYV